MVEIIFEAHGTTTDNEKGLASGWNDPELSKLGISQAKELGQRYVGEHFDAVFCSGQKRSYTTAEIAFAGRNATIIKDPRLNECNYGAYNGAPSAEVEGLKSHFIDKPFPEGESYTETTNRMKSFLNDLQKEYDGKRVMIIGHRATQYGLEYWLNHTPLAQSVSAKFKWQPGWTYQLTQTINN